MWPYEPIEIFLVVFLSELYQDSQCILLSLNYILMTNFYFKFRFLFLLTLHDSSWTHRCLEYLFMPTLPVPEVSLSTLFLSWVFSFSAPWPSSSCPEAGMSARESSGPQWGKKRISILYFTTFSCCYLLPLGLPTPMPPSMDAKFFSHVFILFITPHNNSLYLIWEFLPLEFLIGNLHSPCEHGHDSLLQYYTPLHRTLTHHCPHLHQKGVPWVCWKANIFYVRCLWICRWNKLFPFLYFISEDIDNALQRMSCENYSQGKYTNMD